MTEKHANVEAAERLQTIIAESRLTRTHYKNVECGREYVCLLVAMAPICGEEPAERDNYIYTMPIAESCPTDIMPLWMAHMTMYMDAGVSRFFWHLMVHRYAAVAARWHVLDDAAWRRVKIVTLRECLRIVGKHDKRRILQYVIDLIDEEAPAEDPRWQALEDSYCTIYTEPLVTSVLLRATRLGREDPLVMLSHVTDTVANGCAKYAASDVWLKLEQVDVEEYIIDVAREAAWDKTEKEILDQISDTLLTVIENEISKKDNVKV